MRNIRIGLGPPMNQNNEETRETDTENETAQRVQVNSQYLMDFSFEMTDPSSAAGLSMDELSTNVEIEVGGRTVSPNDEYEVVLHVRAQVQHDDKPIYIVEMQYGGLFTVQVPDNDWIRLVLFIECPTLLFPFARCLIARMTQESGLPPLFLKPIDFSDLLQKRLLQEAQSSEEETPQEEENTETWVN